MDKSMMPNADSTYELPQGGIAGLGAVLLRAAEMNWTVMTEVIRFFVQTLVRQRTGQV